MKRLTATLLLALAAAGCLRLDGFVFFTKPVDDLTTDMLATSVVPASLRTEITDLKAEDGTLVNAYLLEHGDDDGHPASLHAQRTGVGVVYAHGQSNNLISSTPRLDILWDLGFTVLGYDARGYGKTQGTATQVGQEADARAAVRFMEQRMGLGRVALYGRSLGTLFMTKIAAEAPNARALILESPVLSLQTIIDDSMSVDTPAGWYMDSAMSNEAELPKFKGALLILHGDADDYVKFEYGQRLHELATASPNEFVRVTGADHGNVPCTDLVTVRPDDARDDCLGGTSVLYAESVGGFLDRAFASQ
jgi:pimeloyl-ACP methyl ester carboxylesterase